MKNSPTPWRSRRLTHEIKENLSRFFRQHITDPRLNHVNVTSVTLSPDLSQAAIYFVLFSDNGLIDSPDDIAKVKQALKKTNTFLRKLLAQHTALRRIPQLQFIHDESLHRAKRLQTLLEHVNMGQ